jgi:hypothetical protein
MRKDPVIFVFVLAIVVSGCNRNPFDIFISESRLLNLLKQESLAVAETITKKSPDSFVVTLEECVDHKTWRVCYYRATYSFPGISAEELRLMAENAGWSPDSRSLPSTPEGSHLHPSHRESFAKYLSNMEYRYCHSTLKVNDDELSIHCYVKK